MSKFLPCPVCSGVPEWINCPTWSFAPRTSQKRGVRCDFISGCRHATELLGAAVIEGPDQEVAVARWNAEAERLFTEVMKNRTEAEAAAFRQRLFSGHGAYLLPRQNWVVGTA